MAVRQLVDSESLVAERRGCTATRGTGKGGLQDALDDL